MNMRSPMMILLKERGHAEHISLQGEHDPLAETRQIYRSTILKYTLASKLRGYRTELSILDGHYLGVLGVRPRRERRKYQFDLRFLSPTPVRVRRVAWIWFAVCAALLGAGAITLAIHWLGEAHFRPALIGGAAGSLGAGLGALVLFLRCTTESLEFHSVHGGVALVSVTGGFGSTRKAKPFFLEFIKHIYAANRERPESREQRLRSEMREHYRLRQSGVLTEQEYERSKARILAAH